MRRLYPLVRVLFALSLLFGSVADAVARSQMQGATGQIVCGASGPVTLLIDAGGHPVRPGHPCGHCLACAPMALLTAVTVARSPCRAATAEKLATAPPALPLLMRQRPAARAPPALS